MAASGIINVIRSIRSRFLVGMLAMIVPLVALAAISYFSLISSLRSLDDSIDPLFHNMYTLRELQYQLRRLPEFIKTDPEEQLLVPVENIVRDVDYLFSELLDSPLEQYPGSNSLKDAHQKWMELQPELTTPATVIESSEAVRQQISDILQMISQFQLSTQESFRSDFYGVLQGRKDVSLLTAALAFFGLLLAITSALLLYVNIFEPLKKIRKGAERIMTGDLNHRIESSDTGDVGLLADSFNCLAGMLKSNQSSIRMHTAHDSLTGLYNKKEFKARFDTELQRAHRYARPFALMMVDIDSFSYLNEKYGHIAGDEVLRVVAVNLSREVRPIDVVVRLENDDFIVVMPDIGVDDALATGERLRNHLKNLEITATAGSVPIQLTVSIGISVFPDDGDNFDELYYRVKKAVGRARTQGDQVVVSSLSDAPLAGADL